MALELVNLTKKFGGGFTLGPLDLKINDSDILVMVGPTGSGKTTVLNLIAGFVKPDQGSIIADGLDMTNIPVESRRMAIPFNIQVYFLIYQFMIMLYLVLTKGAKKKEKYRF